MERGGDREGEKERKKEMKVGEREKIETKRQRGGERIRQRREREVNVHSIIVRMQKFKCLHTDRQHAVQREEEHRTVISQQRRGAQTRESTVTSHSLIK